MCNDFHLYSMKLNREVNVYNDFHLCRENGTVKFLTKGDNNSVDDRGLYAPGQLWLQKKDIVGRAKGYVSFLGFSAMLS